METEAPVGGASAQRSIRFDGKVLVIGPLPPPIMGPALIGAVVREAFEHAGVDVIHVNTQDRRTVFNVGIPDLRNVALGLLHAAQTAWRAARNRVSLVYLPVSDMRWGYARDAVLLVIARALHRPTVIHRHGANLQRLFHSSSPVERWMIKKTLSWPMIAIVSTPGLRADLDGLVPPERIRVLENAIPDPWPDGVEKLARRRQERALRTTKHMRLLYIANDFATKGGGTAVRALAEPGLDSCVLRMIGAPPPEVAADTQRLASRLGIAERVQVLGQVSEERKLAELADADAFVYPTENDAQPLVLLEALASGLPVVATSHGGVPDTLGPAGLVVEPGDHRLVAERLRLLIEDIELRGRQGALARERYVERYSIPAFNERFAVICMELFATDGPSP